MRKTKLGLAAVTLAATLGLSACSGGSSTESTAGTGDGSPAGTLRLGVAAPVTSFAAANASWANESPYMQAVYDTLLRMDPDGALEPNLATSWEWDDTKTILTLELRDDVTFSDGTTFDADVAAQNIMRFRDGTSADAATLRNVENAVAIDDDTLEIELSQPDPALPVYLSQNGGLQESPSAFDSEDIDTTPIGSGPYVLNEAETVVGSTYVFDAREDYWNPDDQHYAKIVMSVFTDATALLNAVQAGQLDATRVIDNVIADQVNAAGWTLVPGELNWAGFLLLDRDGALTPALADVRVRQALNYAVDRDAILQTIGQGYGTVTQQIFSPASAGYDASLDDYYSYDPEKARGLLTEAGYPDGFDLMIPSSAGFSSAMPLFQQMFADIGVNLITDEVQPADYLSSILGAKYSAAYLFLQQDPTDWQFLQFQVIADSTWNSFNYYDPTVEDLAKTVQTGNEDEAAEAAKEINSYIVENAWNIPLYRPQQFYATNPDTTAVWQTGNSYPYLWNIKPSDA